MKTCELCYNRIHCNLRGGLEKLIKENGYHFEFMIDTTLENVFVSVAEYCNWFHINEPDKLRRII